MLLYFWNKVHPPYNNWNRNSLHLENNNVMYCFRSEITIVYAFPHGNTITIYYMSKRIILNPDAQAAEPQPQGSKGDGTSSWTIGPRPTITSDLHLCLRFHNLDTGGCAICEKKKQDDRDDNVLSSKSFILNRINYVHETEFRRRLNTQLTPRNTRLKCTATGKGIYNGHNNVSRG